MVPSRLCCGDPSRRSLLGRLAEGSHLNWLTFAPVIVLDFYIYKFLTVNFVFNNEQHRAVFCCRVPFWRNSF